MTKEKQIKDIENIIFAFTPLDTMRYEVENAASALYHAGYRKQVVDANSATTTGEWVAHSWQYECSVCKNCIEFQDLMATDYDPIADLDYKYCPYCGAKMRKDDCEK